MASVAVNIPESVVKRAMSITGKRTARAAVLAVIAENKTPNEETLRSLRSKERGRTFKNPGEAVAYLRGQYAR